MNDEIHVIDTVILFIMWSVVLLACYAVYRFRRVNVGDVFIITTPNIVQTNKVVRVQWGTVQYSINDSIIIHSSKRKFRIYRGKKHAN